MIGARMGEGGIVAARDPRVLQGYPWNHGDLGVIPEAGGGVDCLARRPVGNHEKRGSR